ncbi:hypothetical protein JCM10212_001661 [Sporobolomyces blumeae]
MSSAQIRLTEPQVFLVGSIEYERARARQRRSVARENRQQQQAATAAAAAAAAGPTSGAQGNSIEQTPGLSQDDEHPTSPGPGSRRPSPERERDRGRSVFHISASRAGSRSRPGSRAPSPSGTGSGGGGGARSRARMIGQIGAALINPDYDPTFVPPNSRGRSASRTRGAHGAASPSSTRPGIESLHAGRSGSLVRDSEHAHPPVSSTAAEAAATTANDPALHVPVPDSHLDEPPPALLRGLLTVTLSKPTRVKEILVRLKGIAKTDWPEGIGPRRLDVVEENVLINVTHSFFSASESTSNRRAASVGPGGSRSRDASRGRTTSRRAASVAPGRDASHGRSYPHHSLFPNGLDENPPPAPSTQPLLERSRPSSTTLTQITSNESLDSPHAVPPVQPGEAAPAYDAVMTAPPSPLHVATDLASLPPPHESLDLTGPIASALRANPAAASYRLNRSPTPSRSPLGMTPSTLPTSPSTSSVRHHAGSGNAPDRNAMPRLARSSTRASQDSQASNSSSQTSHSNDRPGVLSRSTSSLHSSSEEASENDRGRVPTRDASRDSAGSDQAGDLSIVTNGIARHSRTSLRSRTSPSPSQPPSGTQSPTSPSTPRFPPSALKTSKSSSRSVSRARFSLGGISEVLRGKSSSRARHPGGNGADDDLHEDGLRPNMDRRHSSPDGSTVPEQPRPESVSGGGSGRSQSRGRKTALKVLREALTTGHAHLAHHNNSHYHVDGSGSHRPGDESPNPYHGSSGDGWKEFKAGTYVYPISIPVPGTLPPTLSCEFGSVSYSLKATVVRAGALTTNLTAHADVTLVAMPGEDDTEESESIVVERFWETQMKYHVALSGKSFPIGGKIPLTIRLSPLAKVKVFRVSAQLEQKTSYFASVHSGRKLTRHETPRKVMLIRVDHKDPDEPMLPILSDNQDVLADHPLREWFINATSSDDTTPSLLDPNGPWFLEHDLQLPDCSSKITFSTAHEKANMAVSHVLKVMIRVERGDDEFLDSKGKRKRWDIVVETPVHLLSCRCAQNLLPAYTASTATLSSAHPSGSGSGASSSILARALRGGGAAPSSAPHEHVCGGGPAPASATSAAHSSHPLASTSSSSSTPSRLATATGMGATALHRVAEAVSSSSHPQPVASLEQNLLFARLISGETTPNGETPPTYEEISRGDGSDAESDAGSGREPVASGSGGVEDETRQASRDGVGKIAWEIKTDAEEHVQKLEEKLEQLSKRQANGHDEKPLPTASYTSLPRLEDDTESDLDEHGAVPEDDDIEGEAIGHEDEGRALLSIAEDEDERVEYTSTDAGDGETEGGDAAGPREDDDLNEADLSGNDDDQPSQRALSQRISFSNSVRISGGIRSSNKPHKHRSALADAFTRRRSSSVERPHLGGPRGGARPEASPSPLLVASVTSSNANTPSRAQSPSGRTAAFPSLNVHAPKPRRLSSSSHVSSTFNGGGSAYPYSASPGSQIPSRGSSPCSSIYAPLQPPAKHTPNPLHVRPSPRLQRQRSASGLSFQEYLREGYDAVSAVGSEDEEDSDAVPPRSPGYRELVEQQRRKRLKWEERRRKREHDGQRRRRLEDGREADDNDDDESSRNNGFWNTIAKIFARGPSAIGAGRAGGSFGSPSVVRTPTRLPANANYGATGQTRTTTATPPRPRSILSSTHAPSSTSLDDDSRHSPSTRHVPERVVSPRGRSSTSARRPPHPAPSRPAKSEVDDQFGRAPWRYLSLTFVLYSLKRFWSAIVDLFSTASKGVAIQKERERERAHRNERARSSGYDVV